MKTVISKITLNLLLIIGLGGYCQADKKEDVDLPIMKLQVEKSTGKANPKLKKGKGCENLEELKGDTFDDYPMAETISCDKVDCKGLKAAILHNDNFKELPTAKTAGSCEEE